MNERGRIEHNPKRLCGSGGAGLRNAGDDDVAARFGGSAEAPLHEETAKAFYDKKFPMEIGV